MRFYNNCVNWRKDDVDTAGGLCDMIDGSRNITRRAFLHHVDRQDMRELEEGLSYSRHPKQGLTMAKDWHVSYSKSKLHGQTVYFFTHSGIEHVFTEFNEVFKLNELKRKEKRDYEKRRN